MVLTVYADRAGRLWRIAEMCARCAAATPGCRVLDTAPPPARTAPAGTEEGKPAAQRDPSGGTVGNGAAAVFSDHGPSPALVLFTTRYMDAAVNQLRADGFDVRDEDVARLSPFVRHHINMLGRYSFQLPELFGDLRPLLDPDAADED
ncbi:hypothetical protein GCM10009548_87080 [Streptomyces malaysiensis subsp. malaysiensis]